MPETEQAYVPPEGPCPLCGSPAYSDWEPGCDRACCSNADCGLWAYDQSGWQLSRGDWTALSRLRVRVAGLADALLAAERAMTAIEQQRLRDAAPDSPADAGLERALWKAQHALADFGPS